MRSERRWRAIALVATGLALGVVLAGTPAGAHVASWTHNWKRHIQPHVNAQSVRVARVNNGGATALGASNATLLTVSIKAPAKGFVWLDADFNITSGTGCPCAGWFLLKDNSTGTLVPNYKIVQTPSGTYASGAMSWVFPVNKGTRTFDLQGSRVGGTALSADGATLKAMFIPFGATGGKTLARTVTARSATSTG
jgi:hypothetical protein